MYNIFFSFKNSWWSTKDHGKFTKNINNKFSYYSTSDITYKIFFRPKKVVLNWAQNGGW